MYSTIDSRAVAAATDQTTSRSIAACRRSGLQPPPRPESIQNGVWAGCMSVHLRLPGAVDSSCQPTGFLSDPDGETKLEKFWRMLCARPSYNQQISVEKERRHRQVPAA